MRLVPSLTIISLVIVSGCATDKFYCGEGTDVIVAKARTYGPQDVRKAELGEGRTVSSPSLYFLIIF